jgi:hypothetical protein
MVADSSKKIEAKSVSRPSPRLVTPSNSTLSRRLDLTDIALNRHQLWKRRWVVHHCQPHVGGSGIDARRQRRMIKRDAAEPIYAGFAPSGAVHPIFGHAQAKAMMMGDLKAIGSVERFKLQRYVRVVW